MARAFRPLAWTALTVALLWSGCAAFAAGGAGAPRDDGAGGGAQADPQPGFALLQRAAGDPWSVDRALALPLPLAPGRSEEAALPFRLLIEARGSTHTAVVMPKAATAGLALARSRPKDVLSAEGTVCRISRAAAPGPAEAWAAGVAEAGGPIVESPKPHAALGATLVVRGRATGPWFAEARFPVRLLGPDGRVLASDTAVAQGDWMREAYVPFRAELDLAGVVPTRALLVLERANPSGLDGNAGYLMVRLGCG